MRRRFIFARDFEMDHYADATRHRNMAVQYRTMARTTIHESLRQYYLNIAVAFESLAAQEEELAKKRPMDSS